MPVKHPTSEQIAERAAAMADHHKAAAAVREKTLRLRAARMAKEAADRLQADAVPPPPPPDKRRKKPLG